MLFQCGLSLSEASLSLSLSLLFEAPLSSSTPKNKERKLEKKLWECVVQAETVEDVDEWKEALERALEAAPNAALVVGHETAFRNDSHDAFEGFADHGESQIPKLLLCLF